MAEGGRSGAIPVFVLFVALEPDRPVVGRFDWTHSAGLGLQPHIADAKDVKQVQV